MATILRSPDGDGTAVVTPPSEVKTQQPTKIKVGDKEYSNEEAAQLIGQANQALTLKQAAGALFNGSLSVADREAGARDLLKDLGYRPDQIEQWVSQNIRPSVPATRGARDEEAEETPSELDILRRDIKVTRDAQLKEHYGRVYKGALDSDKRLTKIKSAAEKLLPKDKFETFSKKVEDALQRDSRSRLLERMSRSGEKMTEDMISQEMDRATEYVSELMGAAIADASALGRAADTATVINPYKGANKPKVPEFKEGSNPGSLEDQATKWLTSELLDMAEASQNSAAI